MDLFDQSLQLLVERHADFFLRYLPKIAPVRNFHFLNQALRENAPEIRVSANGVRVMDHEMIPVNFHADHPMANIESHTNSKQHLDLYNTASSSSNMCLSPVQQHHHPHQQTQECLSPSAFNRGPRLKLFKTRMMEDLVHDIVVSSTSTSPTSSSSSIGMARCGAYNNHVLPSLIGAEPPPPQTKRAKKAAV